MTKGLRFTEEAWRQIAARNTRWQRGTMLPVVGEANANDQPTARAVVAAIGIDYGRPGGDVTCKVTSERLEDGTLEIKSVEYIDPIPTLHDAVAGPGKAPVRGFGLVVPYPPTANNYVRHTTKGHHYMTARGVGNRRITYKELIA